MSLRRWWIAAIAVGLAITVAAIAAKNHGGILIGLGIGACGFGDWMNHRMETKIKAGGTLTTFERKNRPLGLSLDGIALLVIVLGLLLIIVTH